MKRIAQLAFFLSVTVSAAVHAQSGQADHSNMKGMDHKNCMEMKGMANMDMQGCKDMMSGEKDKAGAKAGTVHTTSAVVKAVDPANKKVTLAHEPIKTLQWPAMTMAFSVNDKALFDKLVVGKKINVEFTQQGPAYVVSAVK